MQPTAMLRFTEIASKSQATSNLLHNDNAPIKGIRAQAGAALAPAMSFAGDPDTGIFNPGSNIIGIVAGSNMALMATPSNVIIQKQMVVSSNIVPADNATQYIGTSNLHFREAWIDTIHISQNTLYLGDTPVLGTDSDSIAIRADTDQSINVKTTGLGVTNLISTKGVTVAVTGLNSVVDVQSSGTGGRIVMGASNEIALNAPTTTIGTNLTVQGNLTVNGTQFTANVQTVEIMDNILLVNKGQVGNGVSAGYAGIRVDRGDAVDYDLVFNETTDKFEMGPVGGLLVPIATEAMAAYSSNAATSASNLAVSASNIAISASNIAASASNVANAALPKSGGTLTGALTGTDATFNTLTSGKITSGIIGNPEISDALMVVSYASNNAPRTGHGALCLSAGDQKIMFLNSNNSIMDTAFGGNAMNSLRITPGKITDSNYGTVESPNGITIDVGGSLDSRQIVRSNVGSVLYLNTARKGWVETGSNLIVNGNIDSYASNAGGTRFTMLNSGRSGSSVIYNTISLGNELVTNGAANVRFADMRYVTPNSNSHNSNYLGIGFLSNDDILNVCANDRVGINTNNPKTALEVNGQLSLRHDTDWNTGGIRFQDTVNSNDSAVLQGANGKLYFRSPGGANGSNGFEWVNSKAVRLMNLYEEGDLTIAGTVTASSYYTDAFSYSKYNTAVFPGNTTGGSVEHYVDGNRVLQLARNNAAGQGILKIGYYNTGSPTIVSGNLTQSFATSANDGSMTTYYHVNMGSTADVLRVHEWRNNTGGTVMYLNRADSNLVLPNSTLVTATPITTSSDDRVKVNESFIDNAMSTINKLRPQVYQKYSSLDDVSNPDAIPKLEAGLIAQEVFYDAPELRHIVDVPVTADSNVIYMTHVPSSEDPKNDPADYAVWGSNIAGVKYNGLIPYMIKALQEVNTRLSAAGF